MSTECEEFWVDYPEFLTPRDVYSLIFQAHRGFINREPFTSDSYKRTYEHSYQPKYESNVSPISSTTDQFIISSENSLEPKQNQTQFEDVVMENYRNEEVCQSLLGLAKARAVIENHRDYHRRKFPTYLTRTKELRGM